MRRLSGVSRAEKVMGGVTRSPQSRDRLRRLKAIEMMPDATIDDLASLLGITVKEAREHCKELGDPRCLS